MEELLILNNFNGMMEVLSGLNSAAVRRMKKTFGGIGPGYAKKLKSMEDLLSHRYSFRAYRFCLFLSFSFFWVLLGVDLFNKDCREHLHTIAPPCIPYMGIYLTDLTFILDGNSDIIDVSFPLHPSFCFLPLCPSVPLSLHPFLLLIPTNREIW